jgi:GNAT superfamily N-acetyltransferase
VSRLRVRAGQTGDEDLLVEGNLAMALETEDLALDPAVLRAGVRSVLQGQRAARYFLAEDADGAVCGQLMITTEWSDWRNAEVWWIQSVYVWPDHRRQGVYRALASHVEQEARSAGARGLRLYVDQRNTPAQAVYRAMGMNGDHYQLFERMFDESTSGDGPG